jgi:hypothetical protein
VVSITVPAAVGGVGVGEEGSIIAHVASQPQRAQVDNREVAGGVKAREPDWDRTEVDDGSVP